MFDIAYRRVAPGVATQGNTSASIDPDSANNEFAGNFCIELPENPRTYPTRC